MCKFIAIYVDLYPTNSIEDFINRYTSGISQAVRGPIDKAIMEVKALSRSELGNSPRTILEELSRIQSHDVILPTTMGTDIRLRCVTMPDSAQSAILDRLGITLPKRMKITDIQIEGVTQ